MESQLNLLQSQMCEILAEAPWSIGTNERSHGFLHQDIEKLRNSSMLECWDYGDVLLSEADLVWSFVQHVNDVFPHYDRFDDMPPQLRKVKSAPTTCERVAFMKRARLHS